MIKIKPTIAQAFRIFTYSNASSASKRSYYDILELQPQFTQKQLRKQFLEKGKSNMIKLGYITLIIISLQKQHNNSNCSNKPTKL